MSRLRWTLVLALCLPWVLSQDAAPPLVVPGSALSASSLGAALDARADAIAVLRDDVIEARRQLVGLRDRVSTLETEAGSSALTASGGDALAEPADGWGGAGIVAGQLASAAALNDVFAVFTADLGNIRAFQALLLSDNEALVARIAALEALGGIEDPTDVAPLPPDEGEIEVPHEFESGGLMLASEMNANLAAVDAATSVEATMVASILARQVLIAARVEVLEAVFEPQPKFTWRMGTINRPDGVVTEGHFIYRNPGEFEPIPIRWTGPDDFEHDWTVTNAAATSSFFILSPLPSGTYQAQATVGGVDFESSISYDTTLTLDMPVIELIAATTSQVDVDVERIDGAEYYGLGLAEVGGATFRWLSRGSFDGPSHGFAFANLELDPDVEYEVWVSAATVPDPWDPRLVPQQVNRSTVRTAPFYPAPAAD